MSSDYLYLTTSNPWLSSSLVSSNPLSSSHFRGQKLWKNYMLFMQVLLECCYI